MSDIYEGVWGGTVTTPGSGTTGSNAITDTRGVNGQWSRQIEIANEAEPLILAPSCSVGQVLISRADMGDGRVVLECTGTSTTIPYSSSQVITDLPPAPPWYAGHDPIFWLGAVLVWWYLGALVGCAVWFAPRYAWTPASAKKLDISTPPRGGSGVPRPIDDRLQYIDPECPDCRYCDIKSGYPPLMGRRIQFVWCAAHGDHRIGGTSAVRTRRARRA